jgi:uncharacterized membrane protein
MFARQQQMIDFKSKRSGRQEILMFSPSAIWMLSGFIGEATTVTQVRQNHSSLAVIGQIIFMIGLIAGFLVIFALAFRQVQQEENFMRRLTRVLGYVVLLGFLNIFVSFAGCAVVGSGIEMLQLFRR